MRLFGPVRCQFLSLQSNKNLEERRIDECNSSRRAKAFISREEICASCLDKEEERLVVPFKDGVVKWSEVFLAAGIEVKGWRSVLLIVLE